MSATRYLPALAIALGGALAGCTTDFEDPSIVLDLRILAVTAEPPEIVVPFDLEDPLAVSFSWTIVCALVVDPGATRSLRYRFTACPPTDDGRCDEPGEPSTVFGEGWVDDPDLAYEAVRICGMLDDGPALRDVIIRSLETDPLFGFGALPVQIELQVEPGVSAHGPVYATKRMLYSPQLPPERVANSNPALKMIVARRRADESTESEEPMVLRTCNGRWAEPIQVEPGEEIRFSPREPAGAREEYVLPTFDGGSRWLTENLTYSWYATAGDWRTTTTGGARDPFGNEPTLHSTWTAPEEPAAPERISLWLVQRDERGGGEWYPMCAQIADDQ